MAKAPDRCCYRVVCFSFRPPRRRRRATVTGLLTGGSLEHARGVSRDLFAWYNNAHHHSGLSYLTPADVHYGRAATVLAVRHRTRLAAYAAHPERFVQGPPRPETLPTAAWINRPPKPTREDAPGATIVTPDDPQHGVISRSQPISADRSITLVASMGSLQ